MDTLVHEGTTHFFNKGFLEEHPLPKEYEDDPQAYYDEHHLAYMSEDVLFNFWGTIQIQVGEISDEDLADLVEKMLAFETVIVDRLA